MLQRSTVIDLELRKDPPVGTISGFRLVMFLFLFGVFVRAVSCRFLTHLGELLGFLVAPGETDGLLLDVDPTTLVKTPQDASNSVVVDTQLMGNDVRLSVVLKVLVNYINSLTNTYKLIVFVASALSCRLDSLVDCLLGHMFCVDLGRFV